MLVPGRWHRVGRQILYTASSRALAMLETIVHLERASPPATFQLLEINIPETLPFAVWDGADPKDHNATATWGTQWLERCETPVARVPSVLSPDDMNWLINPAHPDAGSIEVIAQVRHPWDSRLLS